MLMLLITNARLLFSTLTVSAPLLLPVLQRLQTQPCMQSLVQAKAVNQLQLLLLLSHPAPAAVMAASALQLLSLKFL
jgi:hypothetical protein